MIEREKVMNGFLDNLDTFEVKYTENYSPVSKSNYYESK